MLFTLWIEARIGFRVALYLLSTPFWHAQNRMWLKKQLRDCPDEESKLRKLDYLAQKLEKQYYDISCRANQQHSLRLAMLESIAAVEAYTDPTNQKYSDYDRREAPENFYRARNKIVLYARWIMLGEEKNTRFVKENIDRLEHIQLEEISSLDEWKKVLHSIYE